VSEEIKTLLLDGARPPAETTALYGHDAAQAFLAQSYRSGKGHHAILIEGPEGIGKATLAFRFASHILSHPDPATAPEALADPDADSPVHRQILGGASHNLLHLVRPVDAKTGKIKQAITVDEVRRAGKFLAQTSGTGNWRIVIVDTADDFNRNAANAVLKILEEPPQRSMFIVLSHAPGRLLPTIRSRCLPLALRPLADADLQRALEGLGIPIPPATRDKILAEAGGSVAQAIKLINYGGLDVIEAFDEIFSASGPKQRKAMHRIADAVTRKDDETLFGFFVGHTSRFLTERARALAMTGDAARAFRISELYRQTAERFAIAEAYNLERKQTVLTVLGNIAAAL
jgi:DNA polymerase-3 subunit delta'